MKRHIFLFVAVIAAFQSFSQIDFLKNKITKNPLGDYLSKQPITTSLDDVSMEGYKDESFGNDAQFYDMASLERTKNGGFILKEGFYQFQSQSYCLKAGTHGPGGGDGYMYGPVKGKADDAVLAIVRNSVAHPEIPQQKIQGLLWAIIARCKMEDLSTEHKAVAVQLLSPKQMATLNRSALDVMTGSALTDALGGVPEPLRQIAQAEAELRQMLTTPGSSYAEMERVAVLSGAAPLGEGSRAVPSGRWSLHPDGYYVRYLPSGYSSTRIEIWVPQGSDAVGKEYDPATHIAVPGNTSRQRLIQSGRKKE
jgi:hypothetical protein